MWEIWMPSLQNHQYVHEPDLCVIDYIWQIIPANALYNNNCICSFVSEFCFTAQWCTIVGFIQAQYRLIFLYFSTR